MFKASAFVVLMVILVTTSCRNVQMSEQDEIAYWNHSVIDSSYQLLYQDKDTTRALHYFDSLLQRHENVTAYVRAARPGIKANYYYFFTADNRATARMIDSALIVYNTAELQNAYPRSYVALLLFGGQIAYRLSHYGKANDYFFRAKKLADAHLSPCERTAFNYNIAMVLYRQQNYPASLHYFREAYAQQESCSPQSRAVILQHQEIHA